MTNLKISLYLMRFGRPQTLCGELISRGTIDHVSRGAPYMGTPEIQTHTNKERAVTEGEQV